MYRLQKNPAKWGNVETVLSMIIPGIIIFLLISCNYFGVRPVNVRGVIVSMNEGTDRANFLRCYIGIGAVEKILQTSIDGICPKNISTGDSIYFKAKMGRITGSYLPMNGTIVKLSDESR